MTSSNQPSTARSIAPALNVIPFRCSSAQIMMCALRRVLTSRLSVQLQSCVHCLLMFSLLTQPLPSCVSPGSPAKYEVVTAGEYVKSRLEATYAQSAAE